MSAIVDTLKDLVIAQPFILLAAIPTAILLQVILKYLSDPYHLSSYPGPLPAKFTELWLSRQAGNGNRYEVVHEQHQKLGKFVRLAPSHLSIADPAAIGIVYGHGTGFLKSEFYDAFVSIRRGLFNTRDRTEHTRKRKIVSHVFSQKNVLGFEKHIHTAIHEMFARWDAMVSTKGKSAGEDEFDILNWLNYFAFDVIGSLAFGRPFGMIASGKDMAAVQLEGTNETEYLPAVQILNARGEYSATLGTIPIWMRPMFKRLPWFKKGVTSVSRLAGIAIAAVGYRLDNPSDRDDLLGKLQSGKDENGKPMGREELTAEALTQLIAGSDTTSNSSCAILYYLSNTPKVLAKLRAELDKVAAEKEEDFVDFNYEEVKALPYLQACIDEALRIHSTSALGLPRIVPAGGAEVCGKWFPEGTTLSVPAYTIHRDPSVWGKDVEAYRPERWFEQDKDKIAGAFVPFSFGPRSCVGRNLASMELLLLISSVVQRYDITPVYPGKKLETVEGFLRKPTEYMIKLSRRK